MVLRRSQINQIGLVIYATTLCLLGLSSWLVSQSVQGPSGMLPAGFFNQQFVWGLGLNCAYFTVLVALLQQPKLRLSWRLSGLLLCWLCAIGLSLTYDLYFIALAEGRPSPALGQYLLLMNGLIKSYVMVLAIVSSFLVTLITRKRTIQQLQISHLQTELALLKSQFQPHFLFNALNAIYAMAIQQQQSGIATAVHQLAEIMRYQTQLSFHDTINLEQEVDQIEAYIALNQMRMPTQLQVDFSYPPLSTARKIPPMLLLPLVENAFKFGVSAQDVAHIELQLHLRAERLHFSIRNPDFSQQVKQSPHYQPSGTGLRHLKRRLELLFPNQFSLQQQQANGFYTSTLEFPCP